MADRQIRQRLSALTRGRRRALRSQSAIGGAIIAEGLERRSLGRSLSHRDGRRRWPVFFGALAAAFVSLNLVFAALYSFGDAPIANAQARQLRRPVLLQRRDDLDRRLRRHASADDLRPYRRDRRRISSAWCSTAVMTGLVFARFSRPRARLIFARNPVIAAHDGVADADVPRRQRAQQFHHRSRRPSCGCSGRRRRAEGRRYVGFRPMRLLQAENPALRAELDAVPSDRRRQSRSTA